MNHDEQQKPLEYAVRNQVESVTLNTSKIQEFLDLQESALEEALLDQRIDQKSGSSFTLNSFWGGIAASFAALLLVSSLLLFQNESTTDYAHEVAQEAVKNHLKFMPLDIKTSSIDEARRFFTRLDFSPIKSNNIDRTNDNFLNMLGGRYCSIKGVTAAQLRYQNNDDTNQPVSTLFQVPYDQSLHGELPEGADTTPKALQIKGLDVSLWVEKDLLMVLIKEP